MTVEERIEKINLGWFLMEPALFKVLCSHHVVSNNELRCPMRCGRQRIEYNSDLCRNMSDEIFREYLKAECIRILLKHPYGRQPENCSPQSIAGGSNCVLSDNYKFKSITLSAPADFGLDGGMHFEFYARAINDMQKQKAGGDDIPADYDDASELWEEDQMAEAEINEIIRNLEASCSWGSLAGKLAGQIVASTKVKIDYRKVMQSFRAEVMSSRRYLTRMRPNRRSGFENLGSVYRLGSRLLVAVDVSGSVSDEMASDFFGVINRFFKYGIEEIDVIQFDSEIQGEAMTLKKARRGGIGITGRGGTSFQPVIDYCANDRHRYQGLVIFTDGHADVPCLPEFFGVPLLWVLPDEYEYERHRDLRKIGKACFISDIGSSGN